MATSLSVSRAFAAAAARLRAHFQFPTWSAALNTELRDTVILRAAGWQLAQPSQESVAAGCWLRRQDQVAWIKYATDDQDEKTFVPEKLVCDMGVDMGMPIAATALIDYNDIPDLRAVSTGIPIRNLALISCRLATDTDDLSNHLDVIALEKVGKAGPSEKYDEIAEIEKKGVFEKSPHLIPPMLAACVFNLYLLNDDDNEGNFVIAPPNRPEFLYSVDFGFNPISVRENTYRGIVMADLFTRLATPQYAGIIQNALRVIELFPRERTVQLAARLTPHAFGPWNPAEKAAILHRQSKLVRGRVRKLLRQKTLRALDRA